MVAKSWSTSPFIGAAAMSRSIFFMLASIACMNSPPWCHHLGGGHCCDQQTQNHCGAFQRGISFHPGSPFWLPRVIRVYTRATSVETVVLAIHRPTLVVIRI